MIKVKLKISLIKTFAFYVILFGCSQSISAQTAAPYVPSVKVIQGDLLSPTEAMTYYNGLNNGAGFTFPIGDNDYHPSTDSRLKNIAYTLGYDSTEWAALSGANLITAQNSYVDAAYEYVHNGVEFTPMFGLQHGAMGAAFLGAGTAFDQSNLLVELMHIAGITAKYQLGTFSPTHAEFKAWFGTDVPKVACHILADGGIPATVEGADSCDGFTNYTGVADLNVEILHMWVLIEIDGAEYAFDPSLKKYQTYAGELDIIGLAGITETGARTAFGATTVNAGSYSGFNPQTLSTYLNTKADTLLTELQKVENAGKSLQEVIGGRRLIVESGAPRQTSLTGHSNLNNWDVIPNELTAQVAINISIPETENRLPVVTTFNEVNLPLARIGADFIVLSPVVFFNGGLFSNGENYFETSTTHHELSIFRPGSEDHSVAADTGGVFGIGGGGSLASVSASGENLLLLNTSLGGAIGAGWNVTVDLNAPNAASSGDYLDGHIEKNLSSLTASVFVIQSGEAAKSQQAVYNKFLPQKTNLWYGIYVDDSEAGANAQATCGAGGMTNWQITTTDKIVRAQTDRPELNACGDAYTPGEGEQRGNCQIGLSIVYDEYITFNDACYETLDETTASRTVSHDKRIKTKALMLAQWAGLTSKLVNTYGGVAQAEAHHFSSLGFVTADAKLNTDLSFDNDSILLNIDTAMGYIPLSTNSSSRYGFASAVSSGLSALEAMLLQTSSENPRVSSAATMLDWYAWNANTGNSNSHSGPFVTGNNQVGSANGIGKMWRFEPNTTEAGANSVITGSGEHITFFTDKGYDFIRPDRTWLGPVESMLQTGPTSSGYAGRGGRKQVNTIFRETASIIEIGHLINGTDKGGAGAKLPEFSIEAKNADELEKLDYNEVLGKISVNDQDGSLSFNPPADITLGYGGQSSLDFTRTYQSTKSNLGPLGLGWSHNHENGLTVSTDLEAALGGNNPQTALPVLIAAATSLALSEDLNNHWEAIPQSLMINGWMVRQVFDNKISLSLGQSSGDFYRAPSGSYYSTGSPSSSLVQTGLRHYYEGYTPYLPTDVIPLSIGDPNWLRKDWVRFSQFYDYSDMGFTYTSADKTVYTFNRGVKPEASTATHPCFTTSLKPFTALYANGSSHSNSYCGKDAGAWKLQKALFTTGVSLDYTYTGFGEVASVTNSLTGSALSFVYVDHDGRRDAPTIVPADHPVPDNSTVQGQSKKLKRVYTNETPVREVSFDYLPDGGANVTVTRISPILSTVTAVDGEQYLMSYAPSAIDAATYYDKAYQLTKFTPLSNQIDYFTMEYGSSNGVVSSEDADGNVKQYGINGVRNRSVDPLGNATISHYDPEGRLIELIEPSYEGDAP